LVGLLDSVGLVGAFALLDEIGCRFVWLVRERELGKTKRGVLFFTLTFSPRKWRGGWLVGWLVLAVSVVLSIYMDLVAHAHVFVWVEEACVFVSWTFFVYITYSLMHMSLSCFYGPDPDLVLHIVLLVLGSVGGRDRTDRAIVDWE
jgi:hypothetical protein